MTETLYDPSDPSANTQEDQQDPGPALDQALITWRLVERRTLLLTTALSLVAVAVTAGLGVYPWGVGWLFGQLLVCINLMVLARLYESAMRGSLPKLVTGVLALVKMGAFMGLIWLGLKNLPAHPIGFFLGFTTALSGLVASIVLWGRQHDEGVLHEPLSTVSFDPDSTTAQQPLGGLYIAPDDTLFQRHHEPHHMAPHGSKDPTQ